MVPKKQALIGLFVATFVALPLFVFSVVNVNFNLSKKAQDEPIGGNDSYDYLINQTPLPIVESFPASFNNILPKSTPLENQFFNKYAMYIYAGFLLFVITTILLALNIHKKNSKTQILPPTNI